MATVSIKKKGNDYSSEEAYKSLRTNLQFCGGDKKVIAFTSCTPNEGKSNVTLNLAVSLAEAGSRVLLIDADLRKSVLLARVRAEGKVRGLSHLLSGQSSLAETITKTNVPGLQILFAGPVPPNPAELLGGKMFEELVRTAREIYDYVIIDTPPLGRVIDCAVITKICDGVVMVIEAEAISYRYEQEVKEQLEKTGCPILGAVLNKVKFTRQRYYGKYRKYGMYKAYENYG